MSGGGLLLTAARIPNFRASVLMAPLTTLACCCISCPANPKTMVPYSPLTSELSSPGELSARPFFGGVLFSLFIVIGGRGRTASTNWGAEELRAMWVSLDSGEAHEGAAVAAAGEEDCIPFPWAAERVA